MFPGSVRVPWTRSSMRAVTRGYATSGAYLLGVQAGFEIWEGNTPFTSNSFQVSVN